MMDSQECLPTEDTLIRSELILSSSALARHGEEVSGGSYEYPIGRVKVQSGVMD
jgi:hypothetical protein